MDEQAPLPPLTRMLLRWAQLRAGLPGEPERPDEAWLAPPRPYPGLRAFSPDEGNVFFARDREIAAFLEKLERSSVIVVLGGSGSGKSSLVRAGLIPRLAGGAQVPGRPGGWYTAEFRPGEDANAGLLRGLCDGLIEPVLAACGRPGAEGERALRAAQHLLGHTEPGDDAPALRARAPAILARRLFGVADADPAALREARLDPRALFALASERLDAADRELRGGLRVGPPNLLLLVDQFEEAFRPGLHPQGLRNLADLLRAVSSRQPPGLFLAVTMRSEETHRAANADLAELLTESAIILGPLDRLEERERIIHAPAAAVLDDWLPGWRAGVAAGPTAPVAPAVVKRLLDESQAVLEGPLHGSDQLPLLQHALLRLWDAAAARWQREGAAAELEIGMADLEAVLGPGPDSLDVCLECHAEEAFAAAREAALAHFPPGAARRTDALCFVALCSLAVRDDRNNWARRFTSPERIARLSSDDGSVGVAERAAALAFLEEMARRGFLNRMPAPGESRVQYDVSHEALVRRWRRLREDVLRQAERLADDLFQVDQNLERALAATPEPPAQRRGWGTGAQEMLRRCGAGIRDFGRGVARSWRLAPAPQTPLHRLAASWAWIGEWVRELPELRAAEAVPARVRASLDTVLAPDAAVPRRLAASLLADKARLRDPAARGDLGRIARMEEPWRLARDYGARMSTRPMKLALLATLVVMVIVPVTLFFQSRKAELELRAQRLEAASLSAGIRQLASEVLAGFQFGDDARAPAVMAFELLAAHEWLDRLGRHVSDWEAAHPRPPGPDGERRRASGEISFLRAATALQPVARRFHETVAFRHDADAPVAPGQACISVEAEGDPEPRLLVREVAGHRMGLSWDPKLGWTLLAGAGPDLRPAEDTDGLAQWLPPGTLGGPAGGLVCLAADASLLLTWAHTKAEEERLPQVFSLHWYCARQAQGGCETWAARRITETAILENVRWRDPAFFGAQFRAVRERTRTGEPGIVLTEDARTRRSGFVIAAPTLPLVVDAGRAASAAAVPFPADPPAATACQPVRDSVCLVRLGEREVQVAHASGFREMRGEAQPAHFRVELAVVDRRGAPLASAAYFGARAAAAALVGDRLLIRDEHGLWRAMPAISPPIAEQLRPFRPRPGTQDASSPRDEHGPAFREYRCDDILARPPGSASCPESREARRP